MRQCLALTLVSLAIVSAPPGAAGKARLAGQTKTQVEVNVLRVVAQKWMTWRRFGLVDPRTHLLVDNTEAVCRGRGRRHAGNRYTRFVCVVRPHVHHGRTGLWLNYLAMSRGRYDVRFLAFHR
jgi:hypothetical protein